jgi:hypothetical protein
MGMIDREKVIKGWECHMEADTLKCADCPYREGWRTCNYADTLYKDVYALLKEHEAVKPVFECEEPTLKLGQFHCGNCHASFGISHHRFCPFCGKPVKWK